MLKHREEVVDQFSQVQFPLTQQPTKSIGSSPLKTLTKSPSKRALADDDLSTAEMAPGEGQLILEQAELSRRVFLYLIEKYNLAPAVILYTLYVNNGSVDAAEAYLSDPELQPAWLLSEDFDILNDHDVSHIIQDKGVDSLTSRRTFLKQICENAVGNLGSINSKLR